MKNGKRILAVTVKRMYDDSPDTSHLGEYGQRAESKYGIDRRHKEDCQSLLSTNEETANVLQNAAEHYERAESLNRGEWAYIGIRAEAEIVLGKATVSFSVFHPQTITSPGCWGIESDAGEDHHKEITADELADLREQLRAIGFSARAISTAFQTIKHEEL